MKYYMISTNDETALNPFAVAAVDRESSVRALRVWDLAAKEWVPNSMVESEFYDARLGRPISVWFSPINTWEQAPESLRPSQGWSGV